MPRVPTPGVARFSALGRGFSRHSADVLGLSTAPPRASKVRPNNAPFPPSWAVGTTQTLLGTASLSPPSYPPNCRETENRVPQLPEPGTPTLGRPRLGSHQPAPFNHLAGSRTVPETNWASFRIP